VKQHPFSWEALGAVAIGGVVGYLLHDRIQRFALNLEATVANMVAWQLTETDDILVLLTDEDIDGSEEEG
jgi:hypothetical protein